MRAILLFVILLISSIVPAQRSNDHSNVHPVSIEVDQRWIGNNGSLRDEETLLTIPVVFHILHLGGRENISDAQVMDQLAILNEDFRMLNPDIIDVLPHFLADAADARIEFRLPTKDPLGNCTNGIDRIQTVETLRGGTTSKLNAWPRSQYLNIWVVDAIESGVSGYATSPGSIPDELAWQDGIVILHEYFGSIGTASPLLKHTLTHKVAQYFDLLNTWGTNESIPSGCGDDQVDDTPLTDGNWQCDLVNFNCTSTSLDHLADLSGTTTSNGTIDSSVAFSPRVIQILNNVADTLDLGISIDPLIAVGVSGNSSVPGEFAFSGWGPGASDGAIDPAEMTGALDPTKYYELSITADTGVVMELQQLTLKVRRSHDGPRHFSFRRGPAFAINAQMNSADPQIQILSNIGFFANDLDDGSFAVTIPLVNFTEPIITIRIYSWNAESLDGSFSIDDLQIEGDFGVLESTMNFMDGPYCKRMFTAGQVERMRTCLDSAVGGRNSLWTDETLEAIGIAEGFQVECAPIADLYAVPGSANGSFTDPDIPYAQITCGGTPVQFRNNSGGGEATAWSWTFQDGDPATSTEEDPVVSFNSPGWKTVSLIASNATGSDTISELAVYISTPDEAIPGLATQDLETVAELWPFMEQNYEENLTKWDRYTGGGHSSRPASA